MSCCIEIPENVSAECIQNLQELVSSVRNCIVHKARRTHSNIELEMRLGNVTPNGTFCSDIGELSWMRIMSAMDASSDWTKKHEPLEIIDFFYTHDIEGKQENIRTSRFIKENKIVCEHIVKKNEKKISLEITGIPNLLNNIRVAFNTETVIDKEFLPDITSTSCVRIKHRKSYEWNNWRYDLTKVWSAPTYAAATRMRDDVKKHTTYEIEMELQRSDVYFGKVSHTDEYIAISLLLKVIGLLPKHINII